MAPGHEGAERHLTAMPDSGPTRELDRWLLIGGPLLAMVAGYVNVILLMQFAVPVSHVTGSIAHLALDGARHDASHLQLATDEVLGPHYVVSTADADPKPQLVEQKAGLQ